MSAPLLGWVAGTTRGHHPKDLLIREGGPHEGCTATQKGVLRCTTTPPICATGSIPPGSLKTTILDGATNEELRVHLEARRVATGGLSTEAARACGGRRSTIGDCGSLHSHRSMSCEQFEGCSGSGFSREEEAISKSAKEDRTSATQHLALRFILALLGAAAPAVP